MFCVEHVFHHFHTENQLNLKQVFKVSKFISIAHLDHSALRSPIFTPSVQSQKLSGLRVGRPRVSQSCSAPRQPYQSHHLAYSSFFCLSLSASLSLSVSLSTPTSNRARKIFAFQLTPRARPVRDPLSRGVALHLLMAAGRG